MMLDLFVELVPSAYYWHGPRIGRIWRKRPTEHRGRLVRIRLDVPYDLVDPDPEVVVELAVPKAPPKPIGGELELEQ